MPTPIFRYPTDLTGASLDNLIANELHNLDSLPKRAIIPKYAPYFSDNLIVRDAVTQQILTKGTQYECLQLVEEAAIKTGLEVFEVILILDSNVSSSVLITYQAIGGLYQRTSAAVLDLYNAVINDNRPISWASVLNKPLYYPPSLHNHLFRDLVGFEPLIVELERLRHAITLSNVPVLQAVLDYIDNKTVDEVIMLIPSPLEYSRGRTVNIDLEAVNVVSPYTYYWTIEHVSTDNSDFNTLSGTVNLKTGFNRISVETVRPLVDKEPSEFKLNIRLESITGKVIYRTGVLALNKFFASDYTDLLFQDKCTFDPSVVITPEVLFVSKCSSC